MSMFVFRKKRIFLNGSDTFYEQEKQHGRKIVLDAKVASCLS